MDGVVGLVGVVGVVGVVGSVVGCVVGCGDVGEVPPDVDVDVEVEPGTIEEPSALNASNIAMRSFIWS